MVSFWEKLPQCKYPKCKSYDNVKNAANDNLIAMELEFFTYIAGILQLFLKSYQSDDPVLPFLYFDLKSLVSSLLKLFIKPDLISQVKKGLYLVKIGMTKAENKLPNKEIGPGFGAESKLNELKRLDLLTASEEKKFREECRTFLMQLVSKLFERTTLTSIVVRSASIFDPKIFIAYNSGKIEKILKKLLHHLMGLHRIDASTCNKIVLQIDLFHKEAKSCSDMFTKYDGHEEPLDSFYFTLFPHLHSRYPELSYLLKLMLVLSHGQASVQRGFSLRNSTLKDNISDLPTCSNELSSTI